VRAEDVADMPVVRVDELLIGRVPGVRMVQLPGGGIAVRVWGPSTFVGDNEPLYVVDGVPVHVTPGRGVDWLNPGDVASIRVLKDVSETAAYGVRGGNGVVLITTRRGG
jgi:TonB-dependent SusC/RagA subfamily outer membrane receptor